MILHNKNQNLFAFFFIKIFVSHSLIIHTIYEWQGPSVQFPFCTRTDSQVKLWLGLLVWTWSVTPLSAQNSASKFQNLSRIPLKKLTQNFETSLKILKLTQNFKHSLKILNTHSKFWKLTQIFIVVVSTTNIMLQRGGMTQTPRFFQTLVFLQSNTVVARK